MMNQLEYVIEELERALRVWLYERTDRNLMLVQPDVVEEAIAILKALADARQARVIKKEELGSLPGGSVVWMEDNVIDEYENLLPVTPVCVDKVEDMQIGDESFMAIVFVNGYAPVTKEYGNGYRLWTARPTDEQREAEKWEGIWMTG